MHIQEDNVDDIAILTPLRDGNPNATTTDILGVREAVNRRLEAGVRKIVIDMEDIDMISSLEIGALVGVVRSTQAKNGVLVIAGLRLSLAETFDIVKINTILPIRITRQDAVRDLKRVTAGDRNGMITVLANNPTVDDFRQWWRRQV